MTVQTKATPLFQGAIIRRALVDSLRKLDPRQMVKNPVMFVVYLGAIVTTVLAVWHPSWFSWTVAVWLWFTVVFANLAAVDTTAERTAVLPFSLPTPAPLIENALPYALDATTRYELGEAEVRCLIELPLA